MSFVAVGIAVAGGITQMVMASKGKKEREREQDAANQELAERKAAYEDMDTSNPYANLENVYEDVTVNTQQAEMMNQQMQQAQANTMQQMQAAAGGSGVAGLAQQLMQSGQQQSQAASASIGQQETQNQKMMLQQAAQLQQLEARGERETQRMDKDKIETMFGMAQQRKISADAARQRATDQMVSGIGQFAGGAVGAAAGGGLFGEDIQKQILGKND